MDGLIRGLRDEFLKVVVSFFRSKGREWLRKNYVLEIFLLGCFILEYLSVWNIS